MQRNLILSVRNISSLVVIYLPISPTSIQGEVSTYTNSHCFLYLLDPSERGDVVGSAGGEAPLCSKRVVNSQQIKFLICDTHNSYPTVYSAPCMTDV